MNMDLASIDEMFVATISRAKGRYICHSMLSITQFHTPITSIAPVNVG